MRDSASWVVSKSSNGFGWHYTAERGTKRWNVVRRSDQRRWSWEHWKDLQELRKEREKVKERKRESRTVATQTSLSGPPSKRLRKSGEKKPTALKKRKRGKKPAVSKTWEQEKRVDSKPRKREKKPVVLKPRKQEDEDRRSGSGSESDGKSEKGNKSENASETSVEYPDYGTDDESAKSPTEGSVE